MTGGDVDRDLILVKLGGSLITDKRTPGTPRPAVIRRLAEQLARARDAGHHLVVGHGSGSFGHPQAVHAGLRGLEGGPGDTPALPADVARVQRAAAELHRIVVDSLLSAGAAPFSIPPSAIAVASDGRIEHFHDGTVRMALERGFMPVVYGDVVLDRVRGASICSTETALGAVADSLSAAGWHVRRCLWLGATAGVLSQQGDVLERIPVGDADLLLQAAGGADAPDVTGGMRHRVDAALGLARAGIPSWIGQGAAPGVLDRLLAGAPVSGTIVVP